jgi:ribonuclease P protein component
VLARANRVARADDFKRIVRRGVRVGTPHALLYVASRSSSEPTRLGFIVSKAVGNAVTRNLMSRRLRAIGHDYLDIRPTSADVVIRALPGSPEVSWVTLRKEIIDGLERSARTVTASGTHGERAVKVSKQ